MKNAKYIAASAATVALLAAGPVLADDHGGQKDNELNFGAKISVMAHGKEASSTNFGKIVSELAHSLNGKKEDNHKDKDRATTTASNKLEVRGTVMALNGATITLAGANGTTYTVNAASSTVNGDPNTAIALAGLKIGDLIQVKGTFNAGVVTAAKITDKSLLERNAIQKFSNIRIGVVSAVTGNTFGLSGLFGAGATTVTTNASTTYKTNGQATTSSALASGQLVVVEGTSATSGGITATVVHIINAGANFLKHLFAH